MIGISLALCHGSKDADYAVGQVDCFTSHEELILAYEEAVTRSTLVPVKVAPYSDCFLSLGFLLVFLFSFSFGAC